MQLPLRIPLILSVAGATSEPLRDGEPVTFGVPLPPGASVEHREWTLAKMNGKRTPVQTRVLDCWPDGSTRWLLVDGRGDFDLGSPDGLFLEAGKAADPDLHKPMTLVDDSVSVAVDTGRARFVVRRGGTFPFDQVIVEGSAVLAPSGTGLHLRDGKAEELSVSIDEVTVDGSGPLRADVLVKGSVRRRGGEEYLRLGATLSFYAGIATARVQISLTNPRRAAHPGGFWDLGDPGSVYLKDAVIGFTAASLAGPVLCSPETGEPMKAVDQPFDIYQDSSGGDNWRSSNHINHERRVPTSFRGYMQSSGSQDEGGYRATPIVAMGEQVRRIAVAVPRFWQNCPKGITVEESVLSIHLFPHRYADLHEIQAGEQKTHEFFVSFGSDGITVAPLEWCRTRALVTVDPKWTCATGAVPFLAPLAATHADLIQPAIAGPDSFEAKREAIDEYGWRHFGEIYGDHEAVGHRGERRLVSHYNNQYDALAGLAVAYLRTADPRWWSLMDELAWHVRDVDVYHTDRDKSAYNGGMFWHTYHYGDADTATHRTYPRRGQGRNHGGGPSADHNYTSGFVLHYLMTGDRLSRDTAVGLAEYVINLDDGSKTILKWLDRGPTGCATMSAGPDYCGPGRGPANSVNALLDGFRLTGDRKFLEKAEELIRRVIHPDEDISTRRLDVPEQRWFYTMFLQSLGKYLHGKAEHGELDVMYSYGRASLLHYARWMVEHEYPYLDKPEKLEFPNETWAAQDVRKSDVLYLAAMHAEDEERPRFLERAGFFFASATTSLSRMPTRILTRPIVVLLTSGLLHSWIASNENARAPRPHGAAAATHTVPPGAFLTQRARVKRRLVFAASGACAILVVVLLSWLAL